MANAPEVNGKPRILIIDDPAKPDCCDWIAVGWFALHERDEAGNQHLYGLAMAAITTATDIEEAALQLEEAGFHVAVLPPHHPWVLLARRTNRRH